jgi:hypothetical protein
MGRSKASIISGAGSGVGQSYAVKMVEEGSLARPLQLYPDDRRVLGDAVNDAAVRGEALVHFYPVAGCQVAPVSSLSSSIPVGFRVQRDVHVLLFPLASELRLWCAAFY